MTRDQTHDPSSFGQARFATTQWSVVLAAGRRSSPNSDESLASLCEHYWYPLYAYVRRRGYSADDAKDLTQEFFARLLEKQLSIDVLAGEQLYRLEPAENWTPEKIS